MPAEHISLDNIAVVLHQPRISENIGATARAMRNMGIRRLVVVDPYMLDMKRVRMMATQAAEEVVEAIEFHDTLASALEPFGYVVGTTARLGGQRRYIHSPESIAQKVAAIAPENQVAILFGREDRGLSNEDLRLCHELITIPTAEFSSLNLSQAVMVLSYELFKAKLPPKKAWTPRLANRFELDGMYEGLKDILVRISYLNPDNPDYWLGHLRSFFTRIQVTAREVSIIRGLIRQVNWYGEKRYKDGLRDGRESSEGDSDKTE